MRLTYAVFCLKDTANTRTYTDGNTHTLHDAFPSFGKDKPMNIVVIVVTGLIGTKGVQKLCEAGHEAISASPRTGVDTVTGKGLAEALTGADVLVDLSNSPSFEDQAAMDFFRTAGTNIEAAAAKAGIGHHVALSVVGTDRLQDSEIGRAHV